MAVSLSILARANAQEPTPLPYLRDTETKTTYDIQLHVNLQRV